MTDPVPVPERRRLSPNVKAHLITLGIFGTGGGVIALFIYGPDWLVLGGGLGLLALLVYGFVWANVREECGYD